uniref:DNA mismatch repair protein Msh2 n=1 Tax=Cacopsylla melanoneura TaxID=428564 RepID=A0A8D8SKE5_9HEMI
MEDINKQTIAGLDVTQQIAFISAFKDFPEKSKTSIRFFNRGEYYSVHGDDAELIQKKSNVVYLAKTMGQKDKTLETVLINKPNFQVLIRDLLLVKHYRVEVFSNKTNLKSARGWELEYWASPGNLAQFEELLFANQGKENESLLMAVKRSPNKANTVAVAVVDVDSKKFFMGEIPDDDYFSNLEAFVVQKSPKECLLPAEYLNENKNQIVAILDRNKVCMTGRKKSEFTDEDLMQDVNRLVHFEESELRNAHIIPEMSITTATHCLRSLINYLELMNNEDNMDRFTVHSIDYSMYVHMSSVVMGALHVLPQSGSTSAQTYDSLLGILDRCRTPQGHRLLAQWLKQPLKDLDAIVERHAAVDTLVNNTEARMNLHECALRGTPDMQSLAIRINKKRAGLKECYKVYEGVSQLPKLISILESLVQNAEASNLNTILTSLESLSKDLSKFQEMIETTIDIERFQSEREFFIRPSFDEDLQEMMDRKDSVMDKMKEYLASTARRLNLVPDKTIKLEHSPQGFAYRITMKMNNSIDDRYTILDTVRGGVRFQDDKLATADVQYQTIQKEYEEHQQSIVEEVIGISAGYSSTLNHLGDTLAQLDVLVSFAVASCSAPKPYVRPKMLPMGSGTLVLEQCRHPIVELQPGVSYIPNDVRFQSDQVTFNLVTGPNMGGKSTFIRSVGVAVFLAQVGCFIPCDSGTVSVVDQIFTRVGAADSQHRGLSTFMMEMKETATIIKKCTPDSLVIIDELGRGTSTFDGFGMACAIARELATNRKPFTLFATHFHEIAQLSRVIPTFRNVHVSALEQDDGLILLYQVKPGCCLKSYGVHCAKMAGYPDDMLRRADELMKQYEFDLELAPPSGQADTSYDEQYFNAVQEGDHQIFAFLNQCRSLNQEKDKLSTDELRKQFAKLAATINTDNPFIKSILVKTK